MAGQPDPTASQIPTRHLTPAPQSRPQDPWKTLYNILNEGLPAPELEPYIPAGTPVALLPHIDRAFNAGILSGLGNITEYDIIDNSDGYQYQLLYF